MGRTGSNDVVFSFEFILAVVVGIDRYSIQNLITAVSDASAVSCCSLMSTTIGKSQNAVQK